MKIIQFKNNLSWKGYLIVVVVSYSLRYLFSGVIFDMITLVGFVAIILGIRDFYIKLKDNKF